MIRAVLSLLALGAFGLLLARGPATAEPAQMDLAFKLYSEGRWRAADKAVSEFLADNPKAGDAYRARARVRLDLGNVLGASADLDAAQRNGVRPELLVALRAEKLLVEGNAQGALQVIETTPYDRTVESEIERVRGRALWVVGNIKASSVAFDRAVLVDPESSMAWADMGNFRFDTGRPISAMEAGDRALALDPENPVALMLRAAIMRQVKGPKAAIAVYDEILKREPKHVGALLNSAAALGDIGQGGEMLRRTRRVLAIQPKNEMAFYYLAVLAARAGDHGLARRMLLRARNLRETMPGAILLDSMLNASEGNHAQALDRLEQLSEQQPENMTIRQVIGAVRQLSGDNDGAVAELAPLADRGDADSYTLVALARAEGSLGGTDSSHRLLDRAANINPAPPEPFAVRGDDIYLQLARRTAQENPESANRIDLILSLLARNDTNGALAEAKAFANQYSQSAGAQVIVGDVLGTARQYDAAATYYRRAANLDFSDPVAMRLIAALGRAGRRDEAVAVLTQFLDQNPRSIDALVIAAGQMGEKGQWGRAAVLLEDVRQRIGNRDVLILANLAWARLQLGENRLAVALARAAYRLQPSNAVVTAIYGQALLANGDDDQAAADVLEKAFLMAPRRSDLAWYWAQAAAKAGRKSDAKLALSHALKDPSLPVRKEAMALLKSLG